MSATCLRVLVADDRRDAGHVMKILLERLGHQVIVVENLAGALESARQFRPDVIISDLALEETTDGYVLARTVRSNPTVPVPLLIAVTGYDDDETRRRAIEAGFDHFLVKPPNIQYLLKLLAGIKN